MIVIIRHYCIESSFVVRIPAMNSTCSTIVTAVKRSIFMLFMLILVGSLISCGGGSGSAVSPVTANVANYRVTFKTVWTSGAFPTRFPAGRHFSGLVGATHNSAVTFWQPVKLATNGIKDMAELGAKTTLLTEIDAAKSAGNVLTSLSGNGISPAKRKPRLRLLLTPDILW